MGWFRLRKDQLSDEQLRDALFNAVTKCEIDTLNELVAGNLERITVLFPAWRTVPQGVRADSARTRWWAEGTIAVALAAEKRGDPSLRAQLVGAPDQNDLMHWQHAFLTAQAEAGAGKYPSAIKTIEHLLEMMTSAQGIGVDFLLPRMYGLLGTSYYHLGDKERARSFTVKALEYCKSIGDEEGVGIYTRNLDAMDARRD